MFGANNCAMDPFTNECFELTLGVMAVATTQVTYADTNSLLVCNTSDPDPEHEGVCTVDAAVCEPSTPHPSHRVDLDGDRAD